jgi:hypothetical protein
MISDEECKQIFDQLVMMLQKQGRDDVVVAVQEQIKDLDALPANKLVDAEEHVRPQTLLPSVKKNKRISQQPSLPFIEPQLAEFSETELISSDELSEDALLSYLYPPVERLQLLINAIEAAFPVPIITALTAMNSLDQNVIRFEATSQKDDSFVLSRQELQQQEKNAHDFLRHIEQLRHYINQER